MTRWFVAGLAGSLLAALMMVSPAESCIRFKRPGGSVDTGQRDPADAPPAETPADEPPPDGDTTGGDEGPSTPPPTTPPPTTPPQTGSTGGTTLGGGPERKGAAVDNGTWEVWWELNRVEFFPRRWVKREITPDETGLTRNGPQPLHPNRVAEMWPMLKKMAEHKHVFVAESALITMGRIAANETQRADARRLLEGKLRHRKREVARAAALGLFYVADETSVLPIYEVASDKKADEEVRAFLALTLTNLKHPMATGLLQELADVRDGYYELVSAALMGLGYNGADTKDAAIPTFLEEIAFKTKNVRPEYRALAVESFGRIGDLNVGEAPLRKGLADRDVHVRRSAAIALGVLDYRTAAEREIAAIRAPYEEYVGIPISPDDEAKIKALEAQIDEQRIAMAGTVKDIIKDLGEALRKDNDVFVRRMCAISLGRINAQNPQNLALRFLRGELQRDRIGMREYCILGMAIGGADDAYENAIRMSDERNPSTRGAACIALGLIGNKDRAVPASEEIQKGCDERLRQLVRTDAHPVIKGYAALACGLVGRGESGKEILKMVRDTSSPTPRSYGALGLALLGTQEGADDIRSFIRSEEMRNGFVASHMVYALGLTKDRRPETYARLVDVTEKGDDQYVQAATLAAIGYLSSGEFYPRRHLMARGYNFMLNLEYIDTYFYKL
ncbi:MAG: HEAT repeat domain-containing protein [Planctomycetota bacterium]